MNIGDIMKKKAVADQKDPLNTAVHILECTDAYAATVGLDGRPQVRPVSYLFSQNDALYFMTVKSSRMYAELSKTPYIQLCMKESETVFRLSGKVCFTEESDIIERCISERKDVFEKLGGERRMLMGFFLLGAELEIVTPEKETVLHLPDPEGVLIGITIKKNNEVRDRLARILERRESEPPASVDEMVKLYDGALFVFAEAAKAVWPRMDIQPIERAAVFETWDEREKYTNMAAGLIRNAVIDKPEDLTYWLNKETLKELYDAHTEK